jgi:hypothetical protein
MTNGKKGIDAGLEFVVELPSQSHLETLSQIKIYCV